MFAIGEMKSEVNIGKVTVQMKGCISTIELLTKQEKGEV